MSTSADSSPAAAAAAAAPPPPLAAADGDKVSHALDAYHCISMIGPKRADRDKFYAELVASYAAKGLNVMGVKFPDGTTMGPVPEAARAGEPTPGHEHHGAAAAAAAPPAAAAAAAAAVAVGGKRKEPASPPDSKPPAEAKRRTAADKGLAGEPEDLHMLVETWGDQEQMKLHPAWPKREALVNGIIAAVIWSVRYRISNSSHWDPANGKGPYPVGHHAIREAMKPFEEAAGADEKDLTWCRADGMLTANFIGRLVALRKVLTAIEDEGTLSCWFETLSDSDGKDIRLCRRFQLKKTPASVKCSSSVQYEHYYNSRLLDDEDGSEDDDGY
jgi:hypothetical protein